MPDLSTLQWIIAAAAVLAVVAGWVKTVMPMWRRLTGTLDALGGRPPLVDKASGKEVAPALPPLGVRLSNIDDNLARLADTIDSLNDAHRRIDAVEQRVSVLEDSRVERVVAQAESAHMWRAVADKVEEDNL